MLKFFKKFSYILPASKPDLLFVIVIFVFTSFIEAIGIAFIGPFIALASDFSIIKQYPVLVRAQGLLGVQQEGQFVAIVGLTAIIIFLLKTIITWATRVFIVRFSDKQQRLLIIRMARSYLEAPYVYHITKNSSSITDRLIEVANTFSSAIFAPLLNTLANFLLFISLFLLLCFTSLPIMLGLLTALLPVVFFFNSYAPKLRKWGQRIRDSKEGIIQTVNHAFGSVKETKVIGCERYFEEQIAVQARKLEESHGTFMSFKILPRFVLEGGLVVSVIAILSISVLLNGEGVAGATSVLSVFALASIRLIPTITNSINGVNQLRASSYTVDQIYYELLELSSLNKSDDLVKAPDFSMAAVSTKRVKYDCQPLNFEDNITLERVSYKYPSSTGNVISDLSISIRKGESIAFIGKSGAGKTTLVDIILGLLVPQSGDLTVDGVSIYHDLRAWKNLIAYIPQSIFLIDSSIESNIAFGVPKDLIDYEKIERAIQVAQLKEVIDNLPNGIHTLVGERGILLSGGQRQRIGIARAIYHDRQILVLDEATAALDNETEKLVTDSIASLSADDRITLITIAHRLSTIKDCDRVYMLSGGRIEKFGKFLEVVESLEI